MTEVLASRLAGANVLVLGGSGVIGSRLVEVLVKGCHANVSVLVRNLTRAIRVARYPIDLVHGDVTDAELLDRVTAAKDFVIDLTFPKEGDIAERREAARAMARNTGSAVLKHQVKRLVHLSTISVYGPLNGRILDERSPRLPGKDPYGASKLAGEEEILRIHREQGLPVVVLQPTVVYGPFTGWSAGPISQLVHGTFVLPNDGRGICNAVYIDDVVQAILRAAVTEGVEGEVFLISGDPAVTWREFYGGYEQILGIMATRSMNEQQILDALAVRDKADRPSRRLIATLRQDAELRQVVLGLPVVAQVYSLMKLLTPKEKIEQIKDRLLDRKSDALRNAKPLIFPTRVQLGIYAPETVVSVAKARALLDYAPIYDLKMGMEQTRAWARWARFC